MRNVLSSAFAVAATFAAAVFAIGCSSGDAGCKAGNESIDGACRLLCTKQADCPADFSCATSSSGTKTYCVANAAGVSVSTGQYGTPCNATLKKIADHPDCDSANGFACFGSSPTDADAYCSKYGCSADSDCPGGFFCGSVNAAPNTGTYLRSWSDSTTVCMKRSTFCSPCASDVDCTSRGYTGPALRCTGIGTGAKFCTAECTNDGSCPLDAACTDVGGTKMCTPKSGACIGDGNLCSRCRADSDCKEGAYCYEQEYTKERFCTAVPTAGACATGACGTPPTGAPWEIGCAKKANGLTPTDQCVGLRNFGTDNNGDPTPYLGCWAVSPGSK